MNKSKVGEVSKNNIKLVEYEEGLHTYSDKFFIQSGPIGFWATKNELEDLFTVLNYYLNITSFMECEVNVDGQQVFIQ